MVIKVCLDFKNILEYQKLVENQLNSQSFTFMTQPGTKSRSIASEAYHRRKKRSQDFPHPVNVRKTNKLILFFYPIPIKLYKLQDNLSTGP